MSCKLYEETRGGGGLFIFVLSLLILKLEPLNGGRIHFEDIYVSSKERDGRRVVKWEIAHKFESPCVVE